MSGAGLKNVLLLETVSEEAHRLLQDSVHVLEASSPFSGGELAEQHPVHAIITRGLGAVNPALIGRCRGLEVIARCGVGLDNVDVRFATGQGVKVVNAPGSNTDTVAEHTLGLMLALQRNLYNSIAAVKDGRWDFRKRYQGDEIRGKTLGVVGLGDIGQRVAKLALAFGMDVVYWSTGPKDVPYAFLSFDELLARADIISLHLPLTEGTRGLIDEAALNKMQEHTLLINTARGEIIGQEALVRALENRRIGGFASDVLAIEPPAAEDPLLKMDNVLITPHSASLTARTYNEMCVLTVRNTLALLRGEPVDNRFIFNYKELNNTRK